jgi:hypothetical protein
MRRGATSDGLPALIKTLRRLRRRANLPTCANGPGDPARSKRLGALLYLYRGGPPDPLAFQGELDPDELDALGDTTEDDRHLVNACLEAEAALLRRDFRRVERLLAADMFGEEEVDEVLDSGDVVAHAKEFQTLMALGLI